MPLRALFLVGNNEDTFYQYKLLAMKHFDNLSKNLRNPAPCVC